MLEVRRNRWSGALLRLLGYRSYAARLSARGITVVGRTEIEIAFNELLEPVRVTSSWLGGGIALKLKDGRAIEVRGTGRADTRAFAKASTEQWRQFWDDSLASLSDELANLALLVDRFKEPRRYPAACLVLPFLKAANSAFAEVPEAYLNSLKSDQASSTILAVLPFYRDPKTLRQNAVAKFVAAELERMDGFFNTIERNPLTAEQRLAVVTDEDATLVLAGAGSGKTSVIVAKAAYLIERRIRTPEEILLMAFGAKAAEEMAERIQERCGAPVTARTFHALGYDIIRQVEGVAPALAPHASDDAQFTALLRDILSDLIRRVREVANLIIEWFLTFFTPSRDQWDFKNLDEYYGYVETHELRTLQGERVKSFEECEIANWLYLNGIAYEYEPTYEHELPDNTRRVYTPDFKLTESGVYIEHFGVRRERQEDGTDRLVTAPYIARERYLADMEWKRDVHHQCGTILIETYSYERNEGSLTDALAEKLAPFKTPKPIPTETVFQNLAELGRFDAFTLTLGTFLRHFKSADMTIERCRERAERLDNPSRNNAFLNIFQHVITAYQERLNDRIDFEDMISRAARYVETGRYQSPFRQLLVDEFQDISDGRAKLLNALKAQHADARIFAVGDDWQSIYRFAGSDIHIMRNFGQEFGGTFADDVGVHRVVDLGRTFRSVDRIALPARHFILQNPSQIEKQVVPAGTVSSPAVHIRFYSFGQHDADLMAVLAQIGREADKVANDARASVILLGRYNHQRPKNLSELSRSFPRLIIRFLTMHSSKGLEADHVVILRAETGRWGFPSEMADDPILDLVLPESEAFDHAEERRLFYVALTRARLSVTILASSDSPSSFVSELVENAEYGVSVLGETQRTDHRCSHCGGKLLAIQSKTGRLRFECEHKFLCGNTLSACPVCQHDLPVPDHNGGMECSCGARFPACPECDDGWLVERSGKFGQFLGCSNYPDCAGSAPIPSQANKREGRATFNQS